MAHYQAHRGQGQLTSNDASTIVAQTTPQGRGGIGIVRLSGPLAYSILNRISGERKFTPRKAHFCHFKDDLDRLIDTGLGLFFPRPFSFTGEDVAEFQVHGSPHVLDMLIEQAIKLGARLAQAGEFSYRALLNDKIDLTQAEAIADLIDAGSRQAARLASLSLNGVFSHRIQGLLDQLVHLRLHLEADFDFSENEIEFLSCSQLHEKLFRLMGQYDAVIASAKLGRLMQEGLKLVLAGRPNAGKSSLLNCLTGQDSAIVTEIPGTTRDTLHEQINLDGIPLQIIDTAGLRESEDPIELLGIARTRKAMQTADQLLWILDDSLDEAQQIPEDLPEGIDLTLIRNKIDLSLSPAGVLSQQPWVEIGVSAKTGAGMEALREQIKKNAGLRENDQGEFIARRRHLQALARGRGHVQQAQELNQAQLGRELIAEELRLAQSALGEITGEFSSDDLLGEIFSRFCIGK